MKGGDPVKRTAPFIDSAHDTVRPLLRHRVWLAVLFSCFTFLLMEITHRAVPPTIVSLRYSLVAHLLAAGAIGVLFERVLYAASQRYEATLENIKTIKLMNHHIRN